MDRDRIVRARAMLDGLRRRLKHNDSPEYLPDTYAADFDRVVDNLAARADSLDEFRVAPEDRSNSGIERTIYAAKLDALLEYLSEIQRAHLAVDGYSLTELARDEDPRPGWIARAYENLTRLWRRLPPKSAAEAKESWRGIAREVLSRKRLLLAAAQELRNRNIPNDFKLATVDVFVEKAQKQLSDRATSFRKWGALTAVAALVLIGVGIWRLSAVNWKEQLNGLDSANSWHMALLALRSSTLAGLYAGAVVFLIFISRALLHEMVVLYQRRHALRFGRLFIYLHPDRITVDELQKAFNWNAEYRSAFKDIHAEKIMQGVPGKVLDTTVELARASVDALKQVRTKE